MDLIKLHQDNIVNLVTRRIALLNRPFIAKRILAQLDFSLLGSLAAILPTHLHTLDALSTESVSTIFLQVFYGIYKQPETTIKALDANLEDFTDEQLSSLSMALLLANVHFDTLSDLPKTTGLRQLFLLNCAHLPTSIVFEWLQQEEKDDLAAACIQYLGRLDFLSYEALVRNYAQSNKALTRLSALLVLTLNGCLESSQLLSQESLNTLTLIPQALATACRLHPHIFFDQSPLCAALTGKPKAIHHLIKQMQNASTLKEAYSAWLWLTGRTLPHYPALQSTDIKPRYIPPSDRSVPDVQAAKSWYKRQKWQAQQHYFLGQPLTKSGLKILTKNQAGQCISLLAVHQQLLALPITANQKGFCLNGVMQVCRFTSQETS